jgi:histidinol-phosphate aminotransferase
MKQNPPSQGPSALVREEILALKPYHVASAERMIKLDAMENPYGLPADLRVELGELIADLALNRYPDTEASQLKKRLRDAFGLPATLGLMVGNGSDELIGLAAQALARPGAVMLAPEPSFAMYKMNAVYARMRYVGVPLRPDFSLDLDAFLGAMREHRPALVFIAYPNNPTGNAFEEDEVLRILDEASGFVVLDEAYHVFAGRSFLSHVERYPNLMVMRTVSKLGLAGIRLGYAVAQPQWIEQFEKLRPPYNVSVLTQAVADRTLARLEVLHAQAEQIKAARAKLFAVLRTLPAVQSFPSVANFILIRVPDADRTYAAMQARGVLIRNLHGGHPLLDQCLRVTVGTAAENERMIAALVASI